MSMPSYADPPFAFPPDVVLDLPPPISVNHLRRMDWRSSKDRKGWTKNADAMVLAAKCRAIDPLKLSRISRFEAIITFSEHHTKIDLDNGIKWTVDYLRRIELIEDDGPKFMRRLTVQWGFAPMGCRVTVRACA